jgi:phosphoadenosine phosphosulfate reductase
MLDRTRLTASIKRHVLISDSSFPEPLVGPIVLIPAFAGIEPVSDLPKGLRQRAEDSISLLRAAVADYKSVCYANSLGSESMVVMDLIARAVPEIEMFTIDTGRLFPETYDLIARLQHRYGREVLRIYYPETGQVEGWVAENGINGFRDGADQRRACCGVRKIEPFRRAVSGRGAWVTGIRRGQSASRALAAPVEWDGEYGLHKVSPLLDWSEKEVWDYIRKNKLPYNVLHDIGFPSIGCAPCTRAVQVGEDARSGRWWWERPDLRECGLHPRRAIPTISSSTGG